MKQFPAIFFSRGVSYSELSVEKLRHQGGGAGARGVTHDGSEGGM